GLRRDVELVEKVVQHGTIGIQDDALERAHAQVLQRDRVLVAHRLQMARDDARDGFGFSLRTKGADALNLFRQDDIVMRDVGDHERTQGALAAYTHRTRRAWRQCGQQVQYTVHLLDDDL